MSPQLFPKTQPAANRMLPHRLYISITDKCNANCDFCSFRDMGEPTYNKTNYLALTMGSLQESSYEEIVRETWRTNEFLRTIADQDIYKVYCGILKKHRQRLPERNFFSCYDCYKLRSSKSFTEFFKIKDDYLTSNLTLKQWQLVIATAYRLGIRELVFADAGEPVIEIDKLCCLLDFSNKKFENLTVFTNGHFASDAHSAQQVLARLKRSGLTNLGVSCDFHSKYKFHQSFIPFGNLANIIKATADLKIDIFFSSLFLDYNDALKLKNNLESMMGKKLILQDADWDEPRGLRDTCKYFLNILTSKGSILKKDVFFATKVRLNPRVEASISGEDLRCGKGSQDNSFKWLKKFVYTHARPCFKNQVILSNGLVVCCAMNTY